MKFSWLFLASQVSFLVVPGIQSQDCDPNADEPQCPADQICPRNGSVCEDAVECETPSDCNTAAGFDCTADYCQPSPCTASGQCVLGRVCSQDTDKQCVYPVNIATELKREIVLTISRPAHGIYLEIFWNKGDRASNRIVSYRHYANPPVQYHGEYCSDGSSSCDTSSKGELDIQTGTVTILNIELSDEDYYYYDFYVDNSDLNTGFNYEIKLEVYVTPTADTVVFDDFNTEEGFIEVGTDLTLTCAVNPIKPEALEMYWMIGNERENGTVDTTGHPNGTFRQQIESTYTITKDDAGKEIQCVVVPVYGDSVTVSQFINPGYAPTGETPGVDPPSQDRDAGQTIRITCVTDSVDAVPNTYTFTWSKVGETTCSKCGTDKTLEIEMTKDDADGDAGNYTCQCSNLFGVSEFSVPAEVNFVPGASPPPDDNTTSGGNNIGLIAGIVVGVLVLVVVGVVVAVVLVRRYDCNVSIQKKNPQPPPQVELPSVYNNLPPEPSNAYEELQPQSDVLLNNTATVDYIEPYAVHVPKQPPKIYTNEAMWSKEYENVRKDNSPA